MNDSENISIRTEILQLITPGQAWHYHIIPIARSNNEFQLLIDEEKYFPHIKDEIKILFGCEINLQKEKSEVILKALSLYYRKAQIKDKVKHLSATNESEFLQNLISEAKELGSSDIHIEIYDEKCRIRLRIDGQLIERFVVTKQDYPTIVNKIKIKASLDISEKRLPQDGRIYFSTNKEKFDIRVSTLPTMHGEKIVLRLLNNDTSSIQLEQLGFNDKEISNYSEAIRKPYGIILISGPTGSGKTTTLYGTLKVLNKDKINILTIEDPIEYTLEGINQVQLKESIGLTFSSALRTFLRQDPDIIMLGEIRDGETAQMAIRAALTGHLVLSTIHTNSAWGTISRLVDMGVPSFLIANTLNITVAQRLVRLLCNNCKAHQEFSSNLLPKGFQHDLKIKSHYIATGCAHCYYTGYKGRKAIYEVIPITNDLKELIRENVPGIHDYLVANKINSLVNNAISLFEQGNTSMEEIYPILLNSI